MRPGIFTRFLAEHCAAVTAVEPSATNSAWLRRELATCRNLSVVQEKWEDAAVAPHDTVFCAGTLYVFPDIKAALLKILRHAYAKVLLVMMDDEQLLEKEATAALGLSFSSPAPLSDILKEVLQQMNLPFTCASFSEEVEYSYPHVELLFKLWQGSLGLREEHRFALAAFCKARNLLADDRAAVRVPRRFTAHLLEIPVYQAVRRDGEESVWQEIAKNYDRLVYSEQQKETLLAKLTHRLPGIETAIEIGAGSGTLTLPLVKHLKEIAAVEPSAAMAAVLHASLAEHEVRNVSVFEEKWENMQPAAADAVLAGGCLYVFYEIDTVLRKMLACAKKKVLITHVGNEGLWHFDRRLLARLGAPKPCLFPPLSLLLNVLLQLHLPAVMDITFVTGRKCFTPEQWLRRCQRLLQLTDSPPVLKKNKDIVLHSSPMGAYVGLMLSVKGPLADKVFREQTALALLEIITQERLFIPIAELPFLLAAQPSVEVPALHPTLLTTNWATFAKQGWHLHLHLQYIHQPPAVAVSDHLLQGGIVIHPHAEATDG